MHSLHFAVIKADSGEEACNAVESYIMDWGNENNWRNICGCVSDKNEVYVHDDGGRWHPDNEEFNTIEKLNKIATNWIAPDPDEIVKVNLLIQKLSKKGKLSRNEWYTIKMYAKSMVDINNRKSIKILSDEFSPHEFDANGITNLYGEGDGDHQYVVFIDMHS